MPRLVSDHFVPVARFNPNRPDWVSQLHGILTLRTAAFNVIRQANRSKAALTAVALGVTAMMLAAGFIDWNLRFGRENTIHSQLGHIQVMKPRFLELGRSDPLAFVLPNREQDVRKILEGPGVVAVAPRLLIAGLASSGETTLSFIGEGVDPGAEAQLSSALRFPEGRNLQAGESNSIIVGRGLADNLGLRLGGTLVLVANTKGGRINAVEAKTVGIFESITKAYDDIALRIPISLARQLMRVDGEHLRIVLLDDTARTPETLAWMKVNLGESQFDLVPWTQLADFYNKTASLFAKQVGVIYMIIAVIIVLAISNTMTMSVIQRIGEIGTMMAIGARRRDILLLFIAEGVVLGIVGTIIGVFVGSLLAMLISQIGIPMPPGPGMTWGYNAGILLTPGTVVSACLTAMATTALASLYPAWKASRMEIVESLRALQ